MNSAVKKRANALGSSGAPLISVIIPAYNAARTLLESLQSVRAQTFGDFEAVIVDDGSTDETAEIARNFCAADSRFKYVHQPNGGVSAARNTGFETTRANWIAYQDADDLWFPEKLASQVQLLQAEPGANFIFTNLYFWNGEQDLYPAYGSRKPLPEGDPMRRLIFQDVYATNTVLVRRETLAAAGRFDPGLRLSQDWDMWLRLGEIGLRTRGVREPMARYRRWAGSSTTQRLDVAEANLRVLEKNLALAQSAARRKLYRRSIASARAVRELVRAYPALDENPELACDALLRACQCEPRLKWLRWYLLLKWPKLLGGNTTRRIFQQKFIHKCRGF